MMPELIIPVSLGVSVIFTSFISGVFGMAGGIVLLAILLGSGMDVAAAMTFHGLAQASGNLWRVWLWRHHLDARILAGYFVGAALAFAFFSIFQFVPDRATVLILLGIIPFLVLALPKNAVPQADTAVGSFAAGVSTVGITLVSGVAGPLLDAYFVRTTRDRRDIVATKAGCAFVGNILKTIYFSMASGALISIDLLLAFIAVGTSIVGTSVSRCVLEGMSDLHFRNWTQAIILTIGSISISMGFVDLLL